MKRTPIQRKTRLRSYTRIEVAYLPRSEWPKEVLEQFAKTNLHRKSRSLFGGKRMRPAIKVYADGREILNLDTKAGSEEYHRRKWKMNDRQKGICCLCGLPMRRCDVTFEHENGRGMGGSKRDDRIELPDGSWINGAAHGLCNVQKGSKVVSYHECAKGHTNAA